MILHISSPFHLAISSMRSSRIPQIASYTECFGPDILLHLGEFFLYFTLNSAKLNNSYADFRSGWSEYQWELSHEFHYAVCRYSFFHAFRSTQYIFLLHHIAITASQQSLSLASSSTSRKPTSDPSRSTPTTRHTSRPTLRTLSRASLPRLVLPGLLWNQA